MKILNQSKTDHIRGLFFHAFPEWINHWQYHFDDSIGRSFREILDIHWVSADTLRRDFPRIIFKL